MLRPDESGSPPRASAERGRISLVVLGLLVVLAGVAVFFLLRKEGQPDPATSLRGAPRDRSVEFPGDATLTEPRDGDGEPEVNFAADALEPDEPWTEVPDSRETTSGTASVSGRVVYRDTGKPAVGASVELIAYDSSKPVFQLFEKRSARSGHVDEAGSYTVDGLNEGAFKARLRTGDSFALSAPVEAWADVEVQEGLAIDGIDFVVERGGLVRGVVQSPSGAVESAQVNVLPRDLMGAAISNASQMLRFGDLSTKTDDRGSFEIRGIPFDVELQVRARADDHAPSEPEAIELTRREPVLDLVIDLARGSRISGIARHADGSPAVGEVILVVGRVAEGTVESQLDMFTYQPRRVTTDAGGFFEVTGLPGGGYSVRAGEFNPLEIFGARKSETGLEVSVDGVNDVTGLEILVETESTHGAISGVVLDHRGQPVPGARVQAKKEAVSFLPVPAAEAASTTTDEQGAFLLTGLADTSYEILARKEGFASAKQGRVTTGAFGLELRLVARGTVRGRVVKEDGDPAYPFRLRAQKPDDTGTAALLRSMMGQGEDTWIKGGEDGSFELQVDPGTVLLQVEAEDCAPARSGEIVVSPGGTVDDVLVMVSGGIRLEGRVLLSDGEPVLGATVELHLAEGAARAQMMVKRMMPQFLATFDNRVQTGSGGRYVFEHLARGRYVVYASHPRYAPTSDQTVHLREKDEVAQDLVLSRGAVLEGTVVQKTDEGEKPRVGMMVQAYGAGPLQMSTSDADGHFLIERLPPGEYLITLLDPRGMAAGKGMTMKTRQISIGIDERKEMKVVFGTGYRVHGTVEGLPDMPMRLVTLRRPGGKGPEEYSPIEMDDAMEAARYQAGTALVGDDGGFEIIDVEPGTYILEIPAMPGNPMDLDAYSRMDRTPYFRKEVVVRGKDVELEVRIPAR